MLGAASLVSSLSLAGAVALTSPPAAGGPRGEPKPLWSFHAGAPLSGPPAVADEGTIAVGTRDGYVHALRRDGAFRYSYTVGGSVVASPVVLDDGLVLAASDQRRLFAIKPDGSLLWSANVAGGVASALAVDERERVWFRTGAGTALAMSRRGGVIGFAKIGRSMTVGPVALSGGDVAIGAPDGELRLIGEPGRLRKHAVSGGFWALVATPAGLSVLGEYGLRVYDSGLAERFARTGVVRILCASPLVVLEGRHVTWLGSDGGVLARVDAGEPLRGPGACTDVSLFVAAGTGRLVKLRRTGEREALAVARGTVVSLDPLEPGALLVAYQDGRLVAEKVVP